MTQQTTPDSSVPATALPVLSATIDTLTFFGKTVTFTQKITGYGGDRLFCKALLTEATLIVFIDDVGPGTPMVPATAINSAEVTIKLGGDKTETQTVSGFVFNGGFLHLTAALSADESNVALTLTETKTALGSALVNVPFGYVVVLDDNKVTQLRWIDEPVQLAKANVPTLARVRNPPPFAAGVSGPFGIETP